MALALLFRGGMKRISSLALLCAAPLVAGPLAACTSEDDPYEGEIVKDEDGKADTSAAAVFMDMEFDGQLLTDSSWNAEQTVKDQLLYTIGQLNGKNSVGRLDKVQLTNVVKTTEAGKHQDHLPREDAGLVGQQDQPAVEREADVPADMSYAKLDAFATSYGHSCVDFGAHDVDSGSMWYYFRPERSGCTFTAADVFKVTASLTVSPINTTGKFPEYNKVWEDGALKMVAIFGKYEDGATTSSDAGIAAWNQFIGAMKTELGAHTLTTSRRRCRPTRAPRSPTSSSARPWPTARPSS
jgi:hypothetical protein